MGVQARCGLSGGVVQWVGEGKFEGVVGGRAGGEGTCWTAWRV